RIDCSDRFQRERTRAALESANGLMRARNSTRSILSRISAGSCGEIFKSPPERPGLVARIHADGLQFDHEQDLTRKSVESAVLACTRTPTERNAASAGTVKRHCSSLQEEPIEPESARTESGKETPARVKKCAASCTSVPADDRIWV